MNEETRDLMEEQLDEDAHRLCLHCEHAELPVDDDPCRTCLKDIIGKPGWVPRKKK
jgi:hypothetical protein